MSLIYPIERRLYKRYGLGGLRGFVKFLSRDETVPVELIDAGCGGAGVRLERRCEVSPGMDLRLVVGDLDLPGAVSGIAEGGGHIRMGIRFGEDGEKLLSLPAIENLVESQEKGLGEPAPREVATITDERAITQILEYYLYARKEKIVVHGLGGQMVGCGHASPSGRFIDILCEETDLQRSDAALLFTFNGFISYYVFKERIVSASCGVLRILPPLTLLKKRSRRYPRITGMSLDAYFLDPRDERRFLGGRVVDVDFGGLAALLEAKGTGLMPGTELSKIVVRLPGCGEIQCSGIMRYVREEPGLGEVKAGITITSFFRDCRKVWNRYIFNLLLPSLEDEGFNFETGEFFSALGASGYLAQCGRGASFYSPMLPSFDEFFRISYRAGGEKQFLLHMGDRIMGVASKNRLYSRTFLLHHLGIERGRGDLLMRKEQSARQVLLGVFVDSYLTEDLRYCAIYFNADKKWNRHMYDDFLAGVSSRNSYMYRHFHFMQFDLVGFCNEGNFLGHSEVKTAGKSALEPISSFLRDKIPGIMFEAYDLAADRLDLGAYNKLMGEGIARERAILYCQRFGEIVGVALAESSSHMVNLFNLGDCVRVFVSDDLPLEDRMGMKLALLRKAVCYYASKCKPYFTFFCYDEDPSYAEELGFKKIDLSRELIVERELLPSYIDFIQFTLSALEMKKESRT